MQRDDETSDMPSSAEMEGFAAEERRLSALQGSEKRTSEKVKVGLTISADLVEAVRDYIYLQRKAGNRFKINDVYEAALRSYLSIDETDNTDTKKDRK